MSIGKRKKDNLKDHPGLALVTPVAMPTSDDPLLFWTNHATQNTLVDLRPFAGGETQNPHPGGPTVGGWLGPFSGRPKLTADIVAALKSKLSLVAPGTVSNYLSALRAWWRHFDSMEATDLLNGRTISRVESVADLNELHEATAHQQKLSTAYFRSFLAVVNEARRLQRLPPLSWVPPKGGTSDQSLSPEKHALEIKTAIKQEWQSVQQRWERYDNVRAESDRRTRGDIPAELTDEDERTLKNWQHFDRIKTETRRELPSGEQLLDGKYPTAFKNLGFECRLMRAIEHPTVQDADIAIHLAIINSGWNPSTMCALDASEPFLVSDSPKDDRFWVLTLHEADIDTGDEITMAADKARAGGRTQFCTALKKDPNSPPMIVSAFLERTKALRKLLQMELAEETAELKRLEKAGTHVVAYGEQFKRVQELRHGVRSVWLYLTPRGQINWLDWRSWNRYVHPEDKKKHVSWLFLLLRKLNSRKERERERIGYVTPSDFRDIYGRWVYVKTGGNILAVMLALGHSSIASTVGYLEKNIYGAEHDDRIREFYRAFFGELGRGRMDLTILAQLVRHGELTPEMEEKLLGYRKLMRSRMGVACEEPCEPPIHIAPEHPTGKLCGTQRCLKKCDHAKFLPESLDGVAMAVEELTTMSDKLPRETWLGGSFDEELAAGEFVLETLYPSDAVRKAREKWRALIQTGKHLIPGLGFADSDETEVPA